MSKLLTTFSVIGSVEFQVNGNKMLTKAQIAVIVQTGLRSISDSLGVQSQGSGVMNCCQFDVQAGPLPDLRSNEQVAADIENDKLLLTDSRLA